MTAAATVHDPVCHMDIDAETAAATSEFEGSIYYFCAAGCKSDFDEDPLGVLAAETAHDHSDEMEPEPETPSGRRPWWKFWG